MSAQGRQPAARPYLRRGSPLSVFHPSQGFSADAPMMQRIDVGGDSSDDDIPQPMKFSALTKALLESGASPAKEEEEIQHESASRRRGQPPPARMVDAQAGLDTPSRAPLVKVIRKNSPLPAGVPAEFARANTQSPRVVQVRAGGPPDSGRRLVPSPSAHYYRSREGTPVHGFVTPAPSRAVRPTRDRSGSHATPGTAYGASQSRPATSGAPSSADYAAAPHEPFHQFASSHGPDSAARHGMTTTMARSRNASGEPNAPPGSMRVKRVPIGTGSFLRGAPVRRGFRRRESDDNVSPNEGHTGVDNSDAYHEQDAIHESIEHDSKPVRMDSHMDIDPPASRQDFARSRGHTQDPPAPMRRDDSVERSRAPNGIDSRSAATKPSAEQVRRQPGAEALELRPRTNSIVQAGRPVLHRKASVDSIGSRPTADQVLQQQQQQRRPSTSHAAQQRPSSRAHTDVQSDQENMPPPTFKRNKDQDFLYLGKAEKVGVHQDAKSRLVANTPVPVPPGYHSPRRALTAMSGNTPVRPAPPPPPKMSILDTATKSAGASTTKSKKKRAHILINGKLFTQMNKIGKGGSSDVYCVMADNYKLFALKKVKLEDCDETAMRGFKGEIDLLQKLTDVDRVVRLFDWELDNEKQILSVLMEKGDNDLNRTLTIELNGPDSRFDPVLTRFYWKEMLECVQAVHEYDIVHSDLKPANFLSVQGKLKLIDFGIANAIDTDNTVNVHRDSHIGTPNYMSPESITDTNATTDPSSSASSSTTGRMMKLGKPSDVWSLGCILYQMVYGRPPFAHIPNQISRILAITNPRVIIDFPSTGVGAVPVPPACKNVLRKCLQRDPAARPTVRDLLSRGDQWLYPEAGEAVMMTEDLLGQIIGKVVERCGDVKRGPPGVEEWRQYPKSFMAKIREMVEREGVRG